MQTLSIGQKVNTDYGVFEILDCDKKDHYFCYQQGFDGHSGAGHFDGKYLNTKYEGSCWWFSENEVSLIEESKVSNLDEQPKFKKGDKVVRVGDTSALGVEFGEVYTVDNPSSHSGYYFGELHNHVTLVEVESTPSDKCLELYIDERNYREMNPNDLITISIEGIESEVPLGDIVHAVAILGVTNGYYGSRIWEALRKPFNPECFVQDMDTVVKFKDKQKEALEYFFKPYYDKQQQEKDVLKALIAFKMEEADALVKQLNQLNQM